MIIGLIFLRYISAAFDKRYQELVDEGDGFEDDRDAYTMENVFFVPEEARWSTIAAAAHTPEIGTVIDNAMRAIEAENKTLKNVLPKNYASPDLDKRVLGDVVDIFTNNIDMRNTTESEDLLGRTYEYCIAQFAEKEGVGGGEFYTPSSVVKTLVSILRPFDNCRVYDCCCGSGGMFVQSAKFIQAHSGKRGAIAVYGQEANADTWKMAKMNMAIRGIDADFGPYQADTFTNDLHPTLKADFILANPPFNYHPWNQEKLLDDVRWRYGIPPAGNANYAWIQHMIHHLAPNGKIGLVLANGALSTQSSGEGEIRKKIIEDTYHDLTKLKSTVAFVPCRGGWHNHEVYAQAGATNCHEAVKMALDGHCNFGCAGFGDCVQACRFDAIEIVNGTAKVDPDKCVGCTACVHVCPQELPVIVPYKGAKLVPCASQDDPEVRKQLCWVGCIGCGDCAANCPDGLIHMENGRAVIEPERCEDCNICSYVCPNGVISAREMPEFTYVQVRAMAAQKGGAAK